MRAARRISPALLDELLELADRQLYEYFRQLDGSARPRIVVAWAGEDESAHWFDIARECTQEWLRQQHVREAVGWPLLRERKWLYPVLDTLVRGLPHAYRGPEVADGVSVS